MITTDRREFLRTTLRAAGGLAVAPGLIRQEGARPGMVHGTATGDVTRDRALIWSRTDRPARMVVEWSRPSRSRARAASSAVTGPDADFTARTDLINLPRGQRIFYRVQFEDPGDTRTLSAPALGGFVSAPERPRDLTFAWSADTVGQGWGSTWSGGLRMLRDDALLAQPDFFIHCGDTIYGDIPFARKCRSRRHHLDEHRLAAKSKPRPDARRLPRQLPYNLLDDHLRRFNAEIRRS
jgi:alkaline phosphatase D